jgi:D-galactarolactone cycloisomerase
MKITGFSTEIIQLPYSHGGPPAMFGGQEWTHLNTLLVKIDTDDGLTGWGEAFGYNAIPATKAVLDSLVAELVVGRDATDIGVLMIDLQRSLHLFGRYGVTMFALSGVDIALWDLAGKRAELPLVQLLGGAKRDHIPVYASLLPCGDREGTAEIARAALEEGYAQIKLHERDPDVVGAVRDAIGRSVPLMLDTNCAWSMGEALELAHALNAHDLHWLEEPLWPPEDYRQLARFRWSTGLAIAAGENACTGVDFEMMTELGAVNYAQPSVTKVGGISEFRKASVAARDRSVALAPHSPYFGPGLLATLHLIAVSPGIDIHVERLFCKLGVDLYGGALDPVDGEIALPDGPGLGLDPDPAVIKKYRVKPPRGKQLQ